MVYPTITREDMVGQFLKAAEFKPYSEGGDCDVHVICFAEELEEFSVALAEYLVNPADVEKRANIAKEWADVQVTLSNLAWYLELDGQVAFNRVAQNNLTKMVDGKIIRRDDGKILKPEGYQKPDMSGL